MALASTDDDLRASDLAEQTLEGSRESLIIMSVNEDISGLHVRLLSRGKRRTPGVQRPVRAKTAKVSSMPPVDAVPLGLLDNESRNGCQYFFLFSSHAARLVTFANSI